MSPEFLLTAFIVCITPGIGVVYTLSMTLGGGFRAGLWASVGCTIATVLHMAVALAGLAALLLASALLFQTVIVTFASYLVWFWLVRHYPATRIASFTLLTPISGLVAGALVLNEPLTPRLLLALATVVLGLVLVNRR